MDAAYLWTQFREWLANSPYKQELRLLFELALFAILLWQLKRERRKLEAAVGTIAQRVTAIQETVEEAPAEAPPGASAENWETIREKWADVRERLEYLIETNVSDGRRLRKYNNIPRHSYEEVIATLRRDRLLNADAAANLMAMNATFLGLRRARAATPQLAQEFVNRYNQASDRLPTPPDEG